MFMFYKCSKLQSINQIINRLKTGGDRPTNQEQYNGVVQHIPNKKTIKPSKTQ